MALFSNTGFMMLEKGLDATWYKAKIIQHNIANSNTPNYKAKNVEFGTILKEKCKCKYHVPKQEDDKIDLKVFVTEEPFTNQTLDENNVSIELEQAKLADAQYQYSTLVDKVNNEFNMIKSALQR